MTRPIPVKMTDLTKDAVLINPLFRVPHWNNLMVFARIDTSKDVAMQKAIGFIYWRDEKTNGLYGPFKSIPEAMANYVQIHQMINAKPTKTPIIPVPCDVIQVDFTTKKRL